MELIMKYVLLVCAFAASFLFCNQPNQVKSTVISKNSGQSSCVGLLALKDQVHATLDTAQYCWAERLYWSYSGQQVQLLHARIFYTCMSKVTMQVIKNNNGYLVKEEVSSEPEAILPNCDCPYDTYCEFTVDTNAIALQLDSVIYQIDLTKISGCFVLDTQSRFRNWCYPGGYPN